MYKTSKPIDKNNPIGMPNVSPMDLARGLGYGTQTCESATDENLYTYKYVFKKSFNDLKNHLKKCIPVIFISIVLLVSVIVGIFMAKHMDYKTKYAYTKYAIEYPELNFIAKDKVVIIETSNSVTDNTAKDITVSIYTGTCFGYFNHTGYNIKPINIEPADAFMASLPITACVEYSDIDKYMIVYDAHPGKSDVAFKNIIKILDVSRSKLSK